MLRRLFQSVLFQKVQKLTPKQKSPLRHDLPKPPVPQLQHTMLRYLQYAKVLSDGHKGLCLQETELSVGKFISQCGFLQEELEAIAQKDDNWINDFWLSEMYLKVRTALPTNTNPAYVFPMQEFKDVKDQLIYTAWLMRGLAEFKNRVIHKNIDREKSTGRNKVKMCMEQYDRILSCYREPQFYIDKLHYRDNCHDNQHVVVMCNNQAFVVHIKQNNELLSHSEIVFQLEHVYRMAQNRNKAVVVPVAGGSVGNRDDAGAFWAEMKKEPRNVESLEALKGAIFIVCLDSVEGDGEIGGLSYEEQLSRRGRYLINGFGSTVCGLNRWYDATIQVIVSNNGMSGLCIEHSVAEGIVIINMAEGALRFARENMKKKLITDPSLRIQPQPLRWAVSTKAHENLRNQVEVFDKLASDMEMKIYNHRAFGKEFIKGCHVSPDGFIQLTLQLAYYKLHGHMVSSYESAAIRRFRKGRVDNIRACTPEALAWAKAMCNTTTSREDRRKAFELAAQKQALVTLENITGNGIDNHLCALNVLAREAVETGKISSLPGIFEEKMWTELMRFPLSTSQVTTSIDIPDVYLCYGPVVPDGYGCAYNIQPDMIIFAVSAFRSHLKTDAEMFIKAITHSLGEIGKMLAA